MRTLETDPLQSVTSIFEVLPRLLASQPSITHCQFLEIDIPPSAEGRPGASPELTDLVEKTRRAELINGSFTETLLYLAAESGVTKSALEVAQFHQPLGDASVVHWLPVEQVSPVALATLAATVPATRMLVVTSYVRTVHGAAHLRLMDFKLVASEENHQHAMAAASRLGRGELLISGSSYHYYGSHLATETELVDWLLRAQLLSRYVDTRWITHQLIERRCALRISMGGSSVFLPTYLTTVS
jgi:hypothetical protein